MSRIDLELLEGAIDTHIHAGPSIFPRLMDAVEVAEAARAYGMRGIVLKHHHTPTSDRAYFVQRVVPEVDVIGGITLNYAVGGLNPFAVDSALKLGGKVVWMPSDDAANHARYFGEIGMYGDRLSYEKPRVYNNVEGITVFDEEGGLRKEIEEILDIIADADAILATSHLDVEESRALVNEARRRGVERILVTHVNFVTASLSLSDQKWFAEKGCLLELCYCSLSPVWRSVSIDEVAKVVREVGPEHYILASDLGQIHNPPPPEGLRIYITMLLEHNFKPEEVRMMVEDNPVRILGLE